MTAAGGEWTVERHLLAGTPETVALYRRFSEVLHGFGPVTTSVAKTTITFKGTRRGFAGARPTRKALVGYLDLMRVLPEDRRVGRASPYGRGLFVHHWRLESDDELDETFIGWLREGYAVGCGAHLKG